MWHVKQSMCWQSEEFQANDPTEKVCQKGWHMIFKLVVRKELGTDTMHTSQEIVGHELRLPLPSQFMACLVVLGLP